MDGDQFIKQYNLNASSMRKKFLRKVSWGEGSVRFGELGFRIKATCLLSSTQNSCLISSSHSTGSQVPLYKNTQQHLMTCLPQELQSGIDYAAACYWQASKCEANRNCPLRQASGLLEAGQLFGQSQKVVHFLQCSDFHSSSSFSLICYLHSIALFTSTKFSALSTSLYRDAASLLEDVEKRTEALEYYQRAAGAQEKQRPFTSIICLEEALNVAIQICDYKVACDITLRMIRLCSPNPDDKVQQLGISPTSQITLVFQLRITIILLRLIQREMGLSEKSLNNLKADIEKLPIQDSADFFCSLLFDLIEQLKESTSQREGLTELKTELIPYLTEQQIYLLDIICDGADNETLIPLSSLT